MANRRLRTRMYAVVWGLGGETRPANRLVVFYFTLFASIS